ncbi:MAG: hypothetical protein ABW221_05650 [Vicinamibacteria bacterium]
MIPRPIAYDVDASDAIVRIEGPWDEFAAQNGAPQLTRPAVLARPFLSFVAGHEMRQLTATLLARVRSGTPISLGFRCDSPSERRHLQLDAMAVGDVVRCTSTLLRSEPRAVPPLLDPERERSGHSLSVCSWCRRIRVAESGWVEVEEAVAARDLFDGGPLPLLTHGICADCTSLLRAGSKRRFER